MNDKGKLIIEQRYSEAVRKGLTGMEGKFGSILKYLGEPLVTHTGGWYTSNPMEDLYEIPDDNPKMPEFDEDEPVMEIGWHFDGSSSGISLEIFFYEEAPDRGWRRIENGGPGPGKELSVWWKGKLVFCESDDSLFCYVPSHEWESHVDYLFGIAKQRELKSRKKQIEETKEEVKKEKLSWLERMRLRWGI